MVKEELQIDLKFLKKIKIEYIFLLAFLILGFYLRVYHIDFPSIGYHNMKENEYLSEAIFFNEQGDFLHRRTFNFWGLEDGPGYFEEYAQAPLIPYMTVPLWKIFGEQIWIPRLLMLLFMLGSIVLTYFIVKKLTENQYLSLLSSFLMTIMPLGIYFGRNIQPESPALFFFLLAMKFYLDWIENLEKKKLLYTMLAVSFSAMFKFTFLIIGIPFLFIFPYKKIFKMFKKERKKFIEQASCFFIGFLPFIIVQTIFELSIVDPSKRGSEAKLTDILQLFSGDFWSRTWPGFSSFIADNYTWWFFWFAVFGLIFVFLKYKTKFSKFILGYTIAVPIYLGILSSKIGGHSYYQMPFLPLICILCAYFIFNIGMLLKQIISMKYVQYAALLLILLTLSDVKAANDRVFSTIFYGQDVVGEYIKAHTSPNERFINLGHSQTQAVCTYARRRCGDFGYNLTYLQDVEKKFNIKYMNIDSYSMNEIKNHLDVLEYIQTNYKIKLIGAIALNDQLVPLNFLLEKGGKFNLTELQTKKPVLAKIYDTKRGDVYFYIIENK